ncbi:MAG: threonine ammonia-lyase IlvA [Alcanivoracaceae bacterium]|nr:threonine ammonia-lyase IlvA [Alcanivoracaceae bacterium]
MKAKTSPTIENIIAAKKRITAVVQTTPLQENLQYSNIYTANILLKREDLQQVRSYKIRGAYNKIAQHPEVKHVVCASAGNHAQGVAYTCHKLGIKGTIFMPVTTPNQKIEQVKMFGQDQVEVRLIGDTFDESGTSAKVYCKKNNYLYIPPFDDIEIIEGQATIALEILEKYQEPIDYIFIPVGGGGLAAGISTVFKLLSPHTKIIGVEPTGAASMQAAMQAGTTVKLEKINGFVDGAAVQQVGELTFLQCKDKLDDIITVDDGLVCQTILNLYNKDAIVVEPAGALALAGLDQYQQKIKDKTVVCILSGSNNDITRIEEIREKALLYGGYKHYFMVRFPQRAGALKEFVADVLGENDDITYFQYHKKHNRAHGPAIVGIELKHAQDLEPLISRMKQKNFFSDYLNDKPELFSMMM